MSESQQWVILVGRDYGAFLFEGTEAEAEATRAHKARWEQAVAKLRLADQVERATNEASQCWNHPGFNNSARHRCMCKECRPTGATADDS
jgi:hypothetical protein